MADNNDPQSPTAGYAASTHGWDTVFAISAGDVNRAIVDKKTSPSSFACADDLYSVTADFGDWQIAQGGDGKNIRLSIPMSDIQLTVLSSGKVIPIPSATTIAEIELACLPHTDTDQIEVAGTNGTAVALKAKTTSDDPTVPVFMVIETTVPEPGSVHEMTLAVVGQLLQEWGNANLAEFNHVFSVVILNDTEDSGQWQFVMPSYVSYAYLDNGGSVDSSLFGVLCMTGGRDGSANNSQIAFNAIPEGSVAGFLISQTRTLYDLVRPAIKLAYPGLTDDNFLMDAAAEKLYLQDGVTIDMPPAVDKSGTYYPKLKALTVSCEGSLFTLVSYTETEIGPGITATCSTIHYYTLELIDTSDGQTLGFKSFQDPSVVHGTHQSEGAILTELLIALAATVALIVLTILTDGAALIIGGLVIGLLMGADQILPPLIEKVNGDDSPSLDLLRVNAIDPIRWPNSKEFKLDYGMLNVSLQLGGNPGFV